VVFKQWWIVLPAAAFLLGGVWALWLMKRRVRAIGYLEREDDLLIRKGLLFRELMVVPYGRIQYLDLEAGPLDRAFGLSNLTINTAAGGLDASLPGLEPEEAAHLRDRLAERGNAKLAGL
jgi:membrane protein YdbS with pleckstrin-like domain